jgi:hypothetical protein
MNFRAVRQMMIPAAISNVTYGALVRVLLWVADMVGRQLDRSLVQSGQEDLCEIDFRHDRPLESTVQSIAFCEISQVCESCEGRVMFRYWWLLTMPG